MFGSLKASAAKGTSGRSCIPESGSSRKLGLEGEQQESELVKWSIVMYCDISDSTVGCHQLWVFSILCKRGAAVRSAKDIYPPSFLHLSAFGSAEAPYTQRKAVTHLKRYVTSRGTNT